MAAERGFSEAAFDAGTPMKLSSIEFAPSRSSEIEAFLAERIYEFNSSATGLFDGEEFAAVIKDSSDRIVAGVSGHTWGGCCKISQLWVHESVRQRGLGKSLMLAVDAHALTKRCTQIVLSSHSFQAPVFYRQFGYIEQGRTSDYPAGHSDIHFLKYIAGRHP
jgi:GNAT superfamily N-acetyltransferase